MATILAGDIGVEYLAANRQKRLYWIGGTLTQYTMNEVYSAMATLLDETTTIDDGSCFSAETPTEYTIGKIDTGDTEPWYITHDLMEHITGGALRTTGWTNAVGTNAGVWVVPFAETGTPITAADEGFTMTHGDGDTGTLLEYIDTGGATDYLVIRPTDSSVSNDFATSAGLITSSRGAFTATQNGPGTTGEQIWTNLYSIGTIDANVHLYAYQGAVATDGDRVRMSSWNDATQDWYGNGHIDRCFALQDISTAAWPVIDAGYITIFARKYGDLYASFEVSASITSGGRNPIPLQTAADLDNTTGIEIETFDGTNFAGTWAVGDIMIGDTSAARGIITAITTPGSTQIVEFIPIDDPQGVSAAWTSGEDVSQVGGAATGSFTDLPSDNGPALSTWFTSNTAPTLSFTYLEADIDDNAVNESYGITIDCNANPLTEVYEWCKYVNRNGAAAAGMDGINGELYIGGEVFVQFSLEGVAIPEGEDVTQETSGATGVVIAYDTTAEHILLRDTRGTFATGSATDHTITSATGNVEVETGAGVEATTFAPKTASPLGTFAGGTFFGARGVLLIDYLAADANSFILTPMEGGTVEVPASFTILVNNLDGGAESVLTNDKVAVFRLTGDGADIDKAEYACVGGEVVGDATITTDAITSDTPGKSTGGVLVLVDDSDGGTEYRLRYASWSGSVFTLDESTGTATPGTTDTQLDAAGSTFQTDGILRGDLVTVAGRTGQAHVLSVNSEIQLTLEGVGIVGMVDTDTFEINTVPDTIDPITSSDTVYVPFIDQTATGATASVSVQYVAEIFYRAKVRNTRATPEIKPFSVDGSTTGADVTVATIRTEDTIIT